MRHRKRSSPSQTTRRGAQGFVGVAVALLIAGWAAGAFAEPPESIREIVQTCASCHGQDGVSAIENTPSLAAQPDIFLQYQLVFIRDGQRKVEAGPRLSKIRGREVRGDPLEREVEARVQQRRSDAVLRFADGPVRKAHDREDGQPATDVHLHRDLIAVDTDEGECGNAGEHAGHATRASATGGLHV